MTQSGNERIRTHELVTFLGSESLEHVSRAAPYLKNARTLTIRKVLPERSENYPVSRSKPKMVLFEAAEATIDLDRVIFATKRQRRCVTTKAFHSYHFAHRQPTRYVGILLARQTSPETFGSMPKLVSGRYGKNAIITIRVPANENLKN